MNTAGRAPAGPATLYAHGRMCRAVMLKQTTIKGLDMGHPDFDWSMEILIRLPIEPLSIEVRWLLVDLGIETDRLMKLIAWLRKREFRLKTWRRRGGGLRLMVQASGRLGSRVASEDYWRKVYQDENPPRFGIVEIHGG